MLNMTTHSGSNAASAGKSSSERRVQQISSWLLMPAPALAAFFLNDAATGGSLLL